MQLSTNNISNTTRALATQIWITTLALSALLSFFVQQEKT